MPASLHNPGDDELLRQMALHDDTEALRQIVARHQARLQRFATRMLRGDASAAQEAVLHAFLQLWCNRQTLRAEGKLGAWLLQTVRNRCIDLARQARPGLALREDDADPAPGPEVLAQRRVQAAALRDALFALPEEQRAVLILSVFEQMTYDEIAQALQIPPGTVASRKHNALARLRERLTDWR